MSAEYNKHLKQSLSKKKIKLKNSTDKRNKQKTLQRVFIGPVWILKISDF